MTGPCLVAVVWRADAVALADRVSGLLTVVRSAEAEIGAGLVEIESCGELELFGYRSGSWLLEHLADIPRAAVEVSPTLMTPTAAEQVWTKRRRCPKGITHGGTRPRGGGLRTVGLRRRMPADGIIED